MEYKDLNENIAAIEIIKIDYDYFNGMVILVIRPVYGYKKEYKCRVYQLVFSECIYLNTLNLSKVAPKGYTEVVSWTREALSERNPVTSFLQHTINQASDNSNSYRVATDELVKEYCLYTFENTLGDAIWLICKGVSVTDVTNKHKIDRPTSTKEIFIKLPESQFLVDYQTIVEASSSDRNTLFKVYCKKVIKELDHGKLNPQQAARQIAPFFTKNDIFENLIMNELIQLSVKLGYTDNYVENLELDFRKAIEKVIEG